MIIIIFLVKIDDNVLKNKGSIKPEFIYENSSKNIISTWYEIKYDWKFRNKCPNFLKKILDIYLFWNNLLLPFKQFVYSIHCYKMCGNLICI